MWKINLTNSKSWLTNSFHVTDRHDLWKVMKQNTTKWDTLCSTMHICFGDTEGTPTFPPFCQHFSRCCFQLLHYVHLSYKGIQYTRQWDHPNFQVLPSKFSKPTRKWFVRPLGSGDQSNCHLFELGSNNSSIGQGRREIQIEDFECRINVLNIKATDPSCQVVFGTLYLKSIILNMTRS